MRFAERLQTIAVTATLTSAAWIVAGSFYVQRLSGPGRIPAPASAPAAAPMSASVSQSPAVSATGLVIPVAGVTANQLADSFNEMRGTHPHHAIDIMAPRGTPVLAAAAGTVEKLFKSAAGGNTIYERSLDRMTIYYYAHLDHYANGLSEGQAVTPGETIGAVGSTGDAAAEAPHLHFEVMRTTPAAKWYDSAADIDPYPLLGGK